MSSDYVFFKTDATVCSTNNISYKSHAIVVLKRKLNIKWHRCIDLSYRFHFIYLKLIKFQLMKPWSLYCLSSVSGFWHIVIVSIIFFLCFRLMGYKLKISRRREIHSILLAFSNLIGFFWQGIQCSIHLWASEVTRFSSQYNTGG